MKKTVLILTYYDRPAQLMRTLSSIEKTQHDNFSVLVVDDKSPTYPAFNMQFGTKFNVEVIYNGDKDWVSQVVGINRGIERALQMGAQNIILQNCECMHIGDILMYTEGMLSDDNYISFATFSLDAQSTFSATLEKDLFNLIRDNYIEAEAEGKGEGTLCWYNHPIKRAKYYDFCSAITATNIRKLNGMDERFKDSIGYSDDDFVARIKRLGLKMEIPDPDMFRFEDRAPYNPFVLHQFHYSSGVHPNKDKLLDDAQNLYIYINENEHPNYKAKHILTPDFE